MNCSFFIIDRFRENVKINMGAVRRMIWSAADILAGGMERSVSG